MSDYALHVGAQVLCPHGGSATPASSAQRVKLMGQPAVTQSSMYTIAGCPFQVPAGPAMKPQPCVSITWLVPATRVRINGEPVLLRSSTALCQSAEQIPGGPPNVVMQQTRVKGT